MDKVRIGIIGIGNMGSHHAKDIAAACLKRGVVVLAAKEKVRLLPPLNISWEDLRQAIQILKGVIAE